MHNQLLLVNKEGKTEGKLYSISKRERIFDEGWLQELLISNPNLLPVKDIDANLDNLIPLGREISVTAGSIDNLYTTSEGLLCVVETKLWRNPEAHRTVVAQILDYAKDLSKMSFEDFKKVVEGSQLRGEKPGFWKRVSKYVKDINQIEFQSKVQESLSQGRFLLLIVGDRIYPEVAMLIETIQSAPNLEFKFGLVEIQFFKKSKENIWPLVAIPKVVGKTHEVIRSVVRIVYEEKRPDIDVDTVEVEEQTKGKTDEKTFKSSIEPKEFADLLIPVFERWIDDKFIFIWGVVGFSVRFFWKGKATTLVTCYPNCIGLLTELQVKKRELPLPQYHRYREAINKIPVARRMLSEERAFVYFRDISLEEFKTLIDETDKMVKSFKNLKFSPQV